MLQVLVLFLGLAVQSPSRDAGALSRWEMVWSDEFDAPGIPAPSNWVYEQGFIRNHEHQYYTRSRKENARVHDGTLVIESRKEKFENPRFNSSVNNHDWRTTRKQADYTSASLITKGKASWQYGRFEVRAKLPTGR